MKRLRERLDENAHGNWIVGFNTFAEVNGPDLTALLEWAAQSRALLAECGNEIGERVLTPDERVALIARIGDTIREG
jgi:hypothetical protein